MLSPATFIVNIAGGLLTPSSNFSLTPWSAQGFADFHTLIEMQTYQYHNIYLRTHGSLAAITTFRSGCKGGDFHSNPFIDRSTFKMRLTNHLVKLVFPTKETSSKLIWPRTWRPKAVVVESGYYGN